MYARAHRVCERCEQIEKTVMTVPTNTEELVELDNFVEQTSGVTILALRDDLCEAAKRLRFLLDYATLTGTGAENKSKKQYHYFYSVFPLFVKLTYLIGKTTNLYRGKSKIIQSELQDIGIYIFIRSTT